MDTPPSYWRLIAHHDDRGGALDSIMQNERIAIGWGGTGDLNHSPTLSRIDIRNEIKRKFPDAKNAVQGSYALQYLISEMKIGDRVFVFGSQGRRPLFEITGDYEWISSSDSFSDYQHTRSVRLLDQGGAKIWYEMGFRFADGELAHGTLVRIEPKKEQRNTLKRYGTIRCWCEVTSRTDIGTDLKCPAVNEEGDEYWSYSLIHEVMPGDIVFHYSTNEKSFVGVSIAGNPVEGRNIFWAARGVSSRHESREARDRAGWWRPLFGFRPLPHALSLANLSSTENFNWLKDWVGRRPNEDHPLMIPFQLRTDGLRAGQGYLFKFPWEIVERFAELNSAADQTTDISEEVVRQSAAQIDLLPNNQSRAAQIRFKSADDYIANISAKQQIRTRSHESLVAGFVIHLQKLGISVSTPHPVDIRTDGHLSVLYEAKVVKGGRSSLFSIREAVGQLFEYRHFIGPRSSQLCIVLNAEPASDALEYVEEQLQISVAWFVDGVLSGGSRWKGLLNELLQK